MASQRINHKSAIAGYELLNVKLLIIRGRYKIVQASDGSGYLSACSTSSVCKKKKHYDPRRTGAEFLNNQIPTIGCFSIDELWLGRQHCI